MGIVQKYARATVSSNLKDDEHHHDHEKLAAVALSGVTVNFPANLLFRVKYANDASSYKALLSELETIVSIKAVSRTWPKHINAHKVARLALEYWVYNVCEQCGGKGYKLVPGVSNFLSDVACSCCRGTAIKPLVCEENWRKYIMEIVESLDSMAVYAGGQAIKKLANDFDI